MWNIFCFFKQACVTKQEEIYKCWGFYGSDCSDSDHPGWDTDASEEHVASLFSFEISIGRNWLAHIGSLQGMLSRGQENGAPSGPILALRNLVLWMEATYSFEALVSGKKTTPYHDPRDHSLKKNIISDST
jgi:hypothetical protein